MDNYHDTHYRLFHTLLPGWLRGELFSPFVDAVVKGDGGSFLVGLWRGVRQEPLSAGRTPHYGERCAPPSRQ